MSDRTPITDATATLGQIITENEKRDAIHIAVENVEAGCNLRPGDHVKLRDGKAVLANTGRYGEGVGLVDPYLDELIEPGQRFWLFLYPGQVTSLRHVWEHPAFAPSGETESTDKPDSLDADEQRRKLREWLEESDLDRFTVDQFLTACDAGYVSDGEYEYGGMRVDDFGIISIDRDASGSVPDWVWDVVRALGVDPVATPDSISCSC